MINTATTPELTNPLISQLDELLRDQASPDWLVIAHSDAHLIQRISTALDEQAVLLAVPQSAWDLNGGRLSEAICWALNTHAITRLMLIGHSQGIAARTAARMVGGARGQENPVDTPPKSSYRSLLAGASQAQSQLQQAQHCFAEQFGQLSRLNDVAAGAAAGSLQLQGLFYLAESGVFFVLDAERQVYYSLLDASACA